MNKLAIAMALASAFSIGNAAAAEGAPAINKDTGIGYHAQFLGASFSLDESFAMEGCFFNCGKEKEKQLNLTQQDWERITAVSGDSDRFVHWIVTKHSYAQIVAAFTRLAESGVVLKPATAFRLKQEQTGKECVDIITSNMKGSDDVSAWPCEKTEKRLREENGNQGLASVEWIAQRLLGDNAALKSHAKELQSAAGDVWAGRLIDFGYARTTIGLAYAIIDSAAAEAAGAKVSIGGALLATRLQQSINLGVYAAMVDAAGEDWFKNVVYEGRDFGFAKSQIVKKLFATTAQSRLGNGKILLQPAGIVRTTTLSVSFNRASNVMEGVFGRDTLKQSLEIAMAAAKKRIATNIDLLTKSGAGKGMVAVTDNPQLQAALADMGGYYSSRKSYSTLMIEGAFQSADLNPYEVTETPGAFVNNYVDRAMEGATGKWYAR